MRKRLFVRCLTGFVGLIYVRCEYAMMKLSLKFSIFPGHVPRAQHCTAPRAKIHLHVTHLMEFIRFYCNHKLFCVRRLRSSRIELIEQPTCARRNFTYVFRIFYSGHWFEIAILSKLEQTKIKSGGRYILTKVYLTFARLSMLVLLYRN